MPSVRVIPGSNAKASRHAGDLSPSGVYVCVCVFLDRLGMIFFIGNCGSEIDFIERSDYTRKGRKYSEGENFDSVKLERWNLQSGRNNQLVILKLG